MRAVNGQKFHSRRRPHARSPRRSNRLMSRLLATRQMRLFLLGDTSSNFGDFALFLAMAIWVKLLSGSTSAAALVMFAFAAGSILLPFAGVLVDRVARRPLL